MSNEGHRNWKRRAHVRKRATPPGSCGSDGQNTNSGRRDVAGLMSRPVKGTIDRQHADHVLLVSRTIISKDNIDELVEMLGGPMMVVPTQ